MHQMKFYSFLFNSFYVAIFGFRKVRSRFSYTPESHQISHQISFFELLSVLFGNYSNLNFVIFVQGKTYVNHE